MRKQVISADKQGFTLVELIVYLATFVILITVIATFAVTSIKTIRKNQIKKEIANTAYSIMRTMLYEIKAATNIYTPTSVFNSHPGQLSLKINQDYLPAGEEFSYIDFYLDNSNSLYLKKESMIPQLLTSEKVKINNLEFIYVASLSESIKINLTVDYNTDNPEYQYSYSLSSAASTRK